MVLINSEKHSSHSRTLILQSALQLFSTRGYDGTSIDDIRQAAGFKSKASLYTHFKNKEEMASALLQDILVERDRAVRLAYTSTRDEAPVQLYLPTGLLRGEKDLAPQTKNEARDGELH